MYLSCLHERTNECIPLIWFDLIWFDLISHRKILLSGWLIVLLVQSTSLSRFILWTELNRIGQCEHAHSFEFTIIISAPTYLPTDVPHSYERIGRGRKCVWKRYYPAQESLGSRYRCSSAAVSYYYCYYYYCCCFASFLHILHYIFIPINCNCNCNCNFVSFRSDNTLFRVSSSLISLHLISHSSVSSLFSCPLPPFPPFTNITKTKKINVYS